MIDISFGVFIRTAILLALLTGVLLFIGFAVGGLGGMTIFLIIAFLINFASFWWSDKIVLGMYGAKPYENKKITIKVSKIAKAAGIPVPKTYLIKTDVPNAFATGRDPKHAAVAVTHGLVSTLDDDEIEGVLAHEIAHIKNRDTLVSVMAATIAGAISYIAQMAWFLSFGDRNRNTLLLLPLVILAPFAAMIIQLAISRGREYGADYTGAIFTKKPLALASALEKISSIAKSYKIRGNYATSHMWIVNPFSGDAIASLFSTHPPIEKRIERLKEMVRKI